MMKPYIVAIFNQKGGISKTTTSTNLAICLAAHGQRVVVVDLDSQGDSTKSLGLDGNVKRGIFDIFIGNAAVEDVIRDTVFPNLRIIPSTYNLAGIELRLSELKDSQRTLCNILGKSELDCDYIIIDCPPALGILPINALASANAVIIPVTATPYAHDGLMRTLPSIKFVQESLNKGLLLQGVLFTIHDKNGAARKIAQHIRQRLGRTVFDAEIPRDTRVIEAATAGVPVCVYAPNSPSAQAHMDFSREFIHRHHAACAKAGQPVPHMPDRDQAMTVLGQWQQSHVAEWAQPTQERVRQGTSRLDRMLYGDRSGAERMHLALVHFFIEHRMMLMLFLLLMVVGLGALLGLGGMGLLAAGRA